MTYLRPSDHAILYHKVLRHGRGYLGHMAAVLFFGHAWLSVPQNGQA